MQYKYYKFPSKEFTPKRSEWPSNVSVEEIGLISNNNETFDEHGRLVSPATYKEGWHINICYQGTVDLSFVEQYEIQVLTPKRTWLGQPV